jgi:prevent-host-death family protein
MPSFGIKQAQKRMDELVKMALRGETVIITRYGKPLVALEPVQPRVGSSPSEPN